MPIVSANTQVRLEGYFRLEWRLAVERTHLMAERKTFLVPIVIDDTIDQDAEVPDSFRAVQWSRLRGGVTSPAFVERVARLLSPAQLRPSADTTPAPRQPVPRPAASRRMQPVPLLITVLRRRLLRFAQVRAVEAPCGCRLGARIDV